MSNHNDIPFNLPDIASRFVRDINLGNLAEDFNKKYAKKVESMGRVNIIIAGRTGAGKSTLINAAFRENIALTGLGDPVTSSINMIEKPGVPVRIYDTVGLELNPDTQKESISEIESLIKSNQGKDITDIVHLIWYCVSVESERFEYIEEKFLTGVAGNDVPVVMVLTKAFDADLTNEFITKLKDKKLPVKDIIPVLAHEKLDYKAYGIDELVEYSVSLLPEAVQAAWINASRAAKLKREKSHKIVMSTVVTNFAVGFVPIPFADAPILAGSQIVMLGSIAATYGLKLEKNDIVGFMSALAGVGGVTVLGRTIAGNLLKLKPGIGTAIGGFISGTTAAVLTYALGNAFIAAMDMIITKQIDKNQITSKDTIKMIKKVFKENLDIGKKKFGKGIPTSDHD